MNLAPLARNSTNLDHTLAAKTRVLRTKNMPRLLGKVTPQNTAHAPARVSSIFMSGQLLTDEVLSTFGELDFLNLQ